MKNVRFTHLFLAVIFTITELFCNTGCEKDKVPEAADLLGTWESVDPGYKLEFTTEKDFLKNGDHYNYWLAGDSITIQYSGVLYIFVKPTTHSFSLKGNILTIDFRPLCYGFEAKKIAFSRKVD